MSGDKPNVRYPLREAREYVRNLESAGDAMAALIEEMRHNYITPYGRKDTEIEGILKAWQTMRHV